MSPWTTVPAVRGGVLSPQFVDDPVGGYRFPRMEDQKGKQGAGAPGRELDPTGLVAHLGRAQDAEVHSTAGEPNAYQAAWPFAR